MNTTTQATCQPPAPSFIGSWWGRSLSRPEPNCALIFAHAKEVFSADRRAEMQRTLDAFTIAYIECALWSSTDNSDESGGDPLDKNYSIEDISDEALARIVADCARFQLAYAELLDATDDATKGEYANGRWTRDELAGHDFWLTRNGHGCGFWDRSLGDVGDKLSKASNSFGSCGLYVGDDGKLYVG